MVRVIESLGNRLDQVESNQEEMKILRRMNGELNKRLEEVTLQVQLLMAERTPVEEMLGSIT
eukprot:12241785-Prorocentrum_lima.AAC.1